MVLPNHSLFLHVWRRNMATMLKKKLFRRALSRLVSGLVAVQLIAAGFCLMMPQAQAMPMAQAAHSMADSMSIAKHCSQAVQAQMDQNAEHSSYTHCDQLDSLLQNVATPLQSDLEMQADLLPAPNVSERDGPRISLFSRTPSGPPRSSSLIYSTSQRILI